MEIKINRDQTFEARPNGSSNFNRNILLSRKYGAALNEDGVTADCLVPGKTIIGYIETNNELIIFSTDEIEGEIGRCKDGVYTCILKDAGLNFLKENPIKGLYTLNYKKEIVITWWDGLNDSANPPRILNIDCLPFEVNPDCTLVTPSSIEELLLSPYINCPTISIDSITDTGGQHEAGAYSFYFAYKFSDGTYSNFVAATSWLTVYEDASTNDFDKIKGVEAGTICAKTFKLKLENLNTNFDSFAIGVISKVGGILSAFIFEDLRLVNSTTFFTFASKEGSVDVALETILIPSVSFERVQAGHNLNNRLYFSNLKTIEDFDYQPYANNIKSEWVRVDSVNLATYPDSYKDVIFINEKRGFAANEVYAFYIVFRLKDGTYSKAFHIPGRAPGLLAGYGNLPEVSRIADMVTAGFPPPDAGEFTAIDVDVRYHEVYSTALQTGEMGVFVNADETYEDTACWDIKNNLGAVIGTLRNTNIRHHRFPDFNQLDGWGSPIYTPSTGTAYDTYLIAGPDGFNTGANSDLDFSITSINGAFLTTTTTTDKLEITCTATFTGVIDINLLIRANNKYTGTAYIVRASGVIEPLAAIEGNGSLTVKDEQRLEFEQETSFNIGDILTVEVLITGSPIIFTPQAFGLVVVKTNNYPGSDGDTTALGIKFTDIFIPDDIKSQIECVHFAYATRTTLNSLKIGTGRVEKYFNSTQEQIRFDDYSLIINKPAVSPAYARTVYYVTKSSTTDQLGININGVFMTPLIELESRQIDKSQYLPYDVSIPVSNEDMDETYLVELVNPFTLTSPILKIRVVDLYNYLKTVYPDFVNQKIALIPTAIDKNAITSGNLYGGDTFIMAAADVLVQDSKDNLSLLYSKTNPTESEYPLGYNSDYTSIQNILNLLVLDCQVGCSVTDINSFPYRIHRSLVNTSESLAFNWRKFLANDYYDMSDRHKGEVWALSSYNRALLIHQKHSLFVALDKDKLASNVTEVYLGTGDVFDRKPEEAVPTKEGYAGCQSYWGNLVCKLGYVFVDKLQGKIFVFNGKLNEISKEGLKTFFRNNLNYQGDEDNPFDTNGIILGYDEANSRILLTKIVREGSTILPESFTYSFSEETNGWVCEHDYLPSAYPRTLTKLFSLNNDSIESRLYDHSVKNGKGIFYRGQIFEAYIELLFNQDNIMSKRWDSIVWSTDVYNLDEDELLYEETVTHIIVYNQYQSTGKISLALFNTLPFTDKNTRHVQHNWFFNKIKDVVINKKEVFIDDRGNIDISKFNNNKSWFNKSNFFGKFIVVRLVIDNIAQRNVYLKTLFPGDIKTNIR